MNTRFFKPTGLALLSLLTLAAAIGLARTRHSSHRKEPLRPDVVPASITSQDAQASSAASDPDEDAPITAWTGPTIPSGTPAPNSDAAPAPRQAGPRFGMPNPKVEAAADGGILVVGFPPGSGAVLAKFGQDGAALWGDDGRGLDLDGVVAISSLVPAPDGGCYLAGTWSGDGSVRQDDQTLFIARFDGRGNALWRAYQGPLLRFGDRGQYRVNRLVPTPDGGCVALGSAHDRDGTHAWVLRLRGDGSPLWREGSQDGLRFRDGGNESLWNAVPMPDGGLVAIGQAGDGPAGLVDQLHGTAGEPRKPDSPYNLVPPTGDAWLLWLDARGHPMGDNGGPGQGRRFTGVHFSDVALSEDGRIFIAGSAWLSPNQGSAGYLFVFNAKWTSTTQDSGPPDSGRTSGPLGGAIFGATVFPVSGGGGFFHVAPTRDGGCLLVGRACPEGARSLETWAVKQDPGGGARPDSGREVGSFLPDDGAAPPAAFERTGGGAWTLYPRRAIPGAPFRLARVREDGVLSWFGGPKAPNGPVAMGAPQPCMGNLLIQGISENGLWALRMDPSNEGRDLAAP